MYDYDGGSGVRGAVSPSSSSLHSTRKSVIEPDTKTQTAPAEELLMYGLFMDGYVPSELEEPSKVVRGHLCVTAIVYLDHKLHVWWVEKLNRVCLLFTLFPAC